MGCRDQVEACTTQLAIPMALSGVVVEGQQAEHAVVAGAEAVEGGPGGGLGQLGPVEGQIAGPQGHPVLPVVAAQCPDRAHPLSFASSRAGGRDPPAGPYRAAMAARRA